MANYMQEAIEFFSKMGLPIKDGLIDAEVLTEEQIQKLEQWERTTTIDGIMMPGISDFYKSVLVAISTNSQRDAEGKIKYLFGKGIGTEIALRGQVAGRTKYGTNPIYRSHSDFELYDAKEEQPYSEAFKRIFGSQEYFLSTETKGLRDIPEGKMDETCETVNLDGYEVLIPQLEMLFLDKFLRRESTPRDGVYDYELLAREYDLDVELIKKYFQEYSFAHYEQERRSEGENYKGRFAKMLTKNLNRIFDENKSTKEAMNRWNEYMSGMSSGSCAIINGINSEMYIPLSEMDTYVDENGQMVITQDYILRTIALISEVTSKSIDSKLAKTTEELDALFGQIELDRTKDTVEKKLSAEDFERVAYDKRTVGTIEKATEAIRSQSILRETKEQGGPSLGDDQ